MKKIILFLTAATLAVSAPVITLAIDRSAMDLDHGGHQTGLVHQEVVDGIKTSFKVQGAKEALKAMHMEMPVAKNETHYIAVVFQEVKSKKALTEGEAKLKVLGPDRVEQTKDLMAMHGEFGAFFDLSRRGKYGVMAKFQLIDGKTRTARFWYTVK